MKTASGVSKILYFSLALLVVFAQNETKQLDNYYYLVTARQQQKQ